MQYVFRFILLISVLGLWSCTKAKIEMSSLDGSSSLQQLKASSPSPFDQDVTALKVIYFSGQCISLVTEFQVQFDDYSWIDISGSEPSASPDPDIRTTYPSQSWSYDTNCSDGQFQFWMYEHQIAAWAASQGISLASFKPNRIAVRGMAGSFATEPTVYYSGSSQNNGPSLHKSLACTDGSIAGVVNTATHFVFSGYFNYVGLCNGGIFASDRTGSANSSISGIKTHGDAHIVVSDGNGGYFIGGNFYGINETYDLMGFAQIKADGSVSNLRIEFDRSIGMMGPSVTNIMVESSSASNVVLVIAGQFDQIYLNGSSSPDSYRGLVKISIDRATNQASYVSTWNSNVQSALSGEAADVVTADLNETSQFPGAEQYYLFAYSSSAFASNKVKMISKASGSVATSISLGSTPISSLASWKNRIWISTGASAPQRMRDYEIDTTTLFAVDVGGFSGSHDLNNANLLKTNGNSEPYVKRIRVQDLGSSAKLWVVGDFEYLANGMNYSGVRYYDLTYASTVTISQFSSNPSVLAPFSAATAASISTIGESIAVDASGVDIVMYDSISGNSGPSKSYFMTYNGSAWTSPLLTNLPTPTGSDSPKVNMTRVGGLSIFAGQFTSFGGGLATHLAAIPNTEADFGNFSKFRLFNDLAVLPLAAGPTYLTNPVVIGTNLYVAKRSYMGASPMMMKFDITNLSSGGFSPAASYLGNSLQSMATISKLMVDGSDILISGFHIHISGQDGINGPLWSFNGSAFTKRDTTSLGIYDISWAKVVSGKVFIEASNNLYDFDLSLNSGSQLDDNSSTNPHFVSIADSTKFLMSDLPSFSLKFQGYLKEFDSTAVPQFNTLTPVIKTQMMADTPRAISLDSDKLFMFGNFEYDITSGNYPGPRSGIGVYLKSKGDFIDVDLGGMDQAGEPILLSTSPSFKLLVPRQNNWQNQGSYLMLMDFPPGHLTDH